MCIRDLFHIQLTNLTITVMANHLSDYCIITQLAVLKIYPECGTEVKS